MPRAPARYGPRDGMSWLLILAILGGIFAPAPTSSDATLRGQATWYSYYQGQAAAGPRLRKFLGPDWRGQRVTVCAGKCVTVKLTDWCACSGRRIVDLDRRDFARLADPGRGVIEVQVSADDGPTPTLPPTDMEEQP